jgi:hypothetical protein
MFHIERCCDDKQVSCDIACGMMKITQFQQQQQQKQSSDAGILFYSITDQYM